MEQPWQGMEDGIAQARTQELLELVDRFASAHPAKPLVAALYKST